MQVDLTCCSDDGEAGSANCCMSKAPTESCYKSFWLGIYRSEMTAAYNTCNKSLRSGAVLQTIQPLPVADCTPKRSIAIDTRTCVLRFAKVSVVVTILQKRKVSTAIALHTHGLLAIAPPLPHSVLGHNVRALVHRARVHRQRVVQLAAHTRPHVHGAHQR